MKRRKDGLKWFGEGFDGFPRTLPEDCVEYAIYVIDSKLGDLEIQQQLRQVQAAATKLTCTLLKGFIWQRGSFHLEAKREEGRRLLSGRTEYGDSVDDEWLIVYILRELTKQFPKLWIRVFDTDGQFLLIEAANSLPPWMNPENADFRVWLNGGKLLLIPLEGIGKPNGKAKHNPKSLDLPNAMIYLENHSPALVHSVAIEAEAFHRLKKYPRQILDSLHHASITVPRKLAYVLHDDAAYISPAVEAFYLRDPIALRPLRATTPTLLIFPPSDLVTVATTFTKVGYAQMKSQNFDPPIIWEHHLSPKGNEKSRQRLVMGMKVTCAFEMLVSDPQNQDKKAVREIKILLDDIQQGADDLPRDTDISEWDMREDDEGWLDINFEDFERELGGDQVHNLPATNSGFGDKSAQDTLRKMVSRFEDFLNDDDAGTEGAEPLDEMDQDNDEDNSSSGETDGAGEGKDISFNEAEFANMMREVMGLSTTTVQAGDAKLTSDGCSHHDESDESIVSVSSDEKEGKEIRKAMQEVEQELREAGALDLNQEQMHEDSKPSRMNIDAKSNSADGSKVSTTAERDSSGEDLDIDFNLAKNLLESFKSQGGASGPGSNMLGLMGVRLPRDEHEQR